MMARCAVLYVSSDALSRWTVSRSMAGSPVRVLPMGAADEALAVAASRAVDGVVVDSDSPGFDPWKLAEQMAHADPSRPVSIVSGSEPGAARAECERMAREGAK